MQGEIFQSGFILTVITACARAIFTGQPGVCYLHRKLGVRITMQIPQHKENDHGQRTAKKEQGSKETQKETDTGNLTFAQSGTSDASGISSELSSLVRRLQV